MAVLEDVQASQEIRSKEKDNRGCDLIHFDGLKLGKVESWLKAAKKHAKESGQKVPEGLDCIESPKIEKRTFIILRGIPNMADRDAAMRIIAAYANMKGYPC